MKEERGLRKRGWRDVAVGHLGSTVEDKETSRQAHTALLGRDQVRERFSKERPVFCNHFTLLLLGFRHVLPKVSRLDDLPIALPELTY